MTAKEPYKWITVKGAHIPVYKDEHGQDVFGTGIRKSVKERIQDLIPKDSYVNTNQEYKNIDDQLQKLHEEQKQLEVGKSELKEKADEGLIIDEELKKNLGYDLAKTLAERTPESEAAHNEYMRRLKRHDEILNEEKELRNKQYKIIDREYQKQLKEFNSTESTITPAKNDYKYFELDTHTSGLTADELKKQGKNFDIVEMSPKEYLQRSAYHIFPNDGFNHRSSTYEQQLYLGMGDANVVEHLMDLMQSGTKMYLPSLDYSTYTQDGRHRALAAMLLGAEKIPVMVVRKKR